MEVITIESGAFKQLVEKLDAISEHLQLIEHPVERDDESWVVSNEICRFLKISDRTLQERTARSLILALAGNITTKSAR